MNKTISQYLSDKEKINSLTQKIISYQDKLEPSLLKEILDFISPYIWFYPKLSFRNINEDIASDFYLYIHERFESLILKYQSSMGKFSTYLAIRLQTYFLNFVTQRKNQFKDIGSLPLLEDQLVVDTSEDNQTEILGETKVFLEQLEKLKLKDSRKYLIVKLYYFDWFDEDDFVLLKDVFSNSYSGVLEKLDIMRNHIYDKKNKQLQYENQLNKLYTKNVSYKEYFSKEKKSNNDQSNEQLDNSDSKWRTKQKQIMYKYLRIVTYPSFKKIAEATELEEKIITNTINSYKKNLKKRIEEI